MITDHDRFMDEIGAYLLGALSDEECGVLERHLDGCEECRRELTRLRTAADALPRAVEPVEPPARLKRELMRSVRAEAGPQGSRAAPRSWFGPALRPRLAWAAAAVVVIAAGAGIGVAASGTGSARMISARVSIPGAHADLVIPPGSATGATLRVSGFPAPPPGHIYELWLRRGDRTLPASLFSVAADGRGAAAVAQSLKGVTAVMVTRELARGASRPTTAPIVVAPT